MGLQCQTVDVSTLDLRQIQERPRYVEGTPVSVKKDGTPNGKDYKLKIG